MFKLHGIKVNSIYNQSGGEGVVKIFSLLFISIFICSSFSPLFANNKRDSEITVEESIKEILDSVNEIIKSGIQAGEKELKELKEKGGAVHKKAEESIMEKLQKILVELRKLEKALKENLAEGKKFSKEKREQYRKNRENLEEKVAQLKKRIKKFAEDIEKECRLLKEPISKRVQEFLKEMERAINSMQERLKRKRTTDKTLSI